MTEYLFRKMEYGLAPAGPETAEWYDKLKPGQFVSGKFKRVRNTQFHRKFFALLRIGYESWEPGELDSKYGKPQKNFEQFRADITILAGYYEVHVRLDKSIRIVPKSINFSSMDEAEFEKLYSATIDVLLKRVYDTKATKADIDGLVEAYLSFA